MDNFLKKKLVDILVKSSSSYYNTGDYYQLTAEEQKTLETISLIGKEVDDRLYDKLETYVWKHFPDTPSLLGVGSKVRTDKVKLPIPLGSMTECKLGEMEKWLVPSHYCISDKLDGISCLIGYENGQLKIAYSRGDGYEGQDITRHLLRFENCPKELTSKHFTGLVRGEIIIPKVDIPLAINDLAETTKKVYKNGRNLCAGQLNSKDCDKSFAHYAHFVAYHINDWEGETHQMFETLTNLGFETPLWRISNNYLMSDDYLMKIFQKVKLEGKYECDGIIVTQEVIDDDHQGFETGTLNPKSSRKFKISGLDDTFISEITNITWQISKDFILKPVINIKPIDHNGVTISNISGNNYRFLVDNDLRIGTIIEGKRSGDVIPQYVRTITPAPKNKFSEEGFNLEQFELEDGTRLYVEEDVELALTAGVEIAPELNLEAYTQRLLYFCTKLGVEYAGYGNIRRLVDKVLVPSHHYINYKELCDIPLVYFEELIGVNGIKFFNSLHDKIESATPSQLADACGCFGRGIGELKLNKIIDKYDCLPNDEKLILAVEGWAEKSTRQYIAQYDCYEDMVKYFTEKGCWTGFDKGTIGDKFKDTKVVFTGVRSKELEQLITLNGGKVLSSCTKECNLVITNNPNGSSTKLNKAREKGIEIISLQGAFERFGYKEEVKPLNMLDNPLVQLLK